MTVQQWQRVKETFEKARDLSASGQDEFLRALGASDPEIVDELRALLAAYHESESFLATGDMQEAAQTDLAAAGLTLRGCRLGAYQVGPLIGVGGMGEVYRGERADGEFAQRVAIKVVRGASDRATVSRFRAERQILAGLSHPNIARLYDGGTTEAGEPYFVMEYIEGQRIDEYCRGRNLDDAQRLRLFQAVCAAAHYAHEHGIVHRDIKPANILVGEDGAPRLVDFGVATAMEAPSGTGGEVTQMRACTPDYASPEQLRNQPPTPVSDVYSLGVVLFEILSGARFERAAGPAGAGGRRLAPELARIVAKATQDEPAKRYPSAAELSAAIDRALAPARSLRRIAVAAAVILILVFAALVWRGRDVAREPRSIAVVEIENLSQDPSLDWMDRGISELLTTGLAQSEKLSVISNERIRSLIGRRAKGDAKLPAAQVRDVAADARADAFISGVLLRLGPRLRLDVKVQDTASGRVLFAHRVEGDDAQAVFRMADETAVLVARQLSGSAGKKAAAGEALTANVEALKAYTEGLRFGQRWLPGKALASMRKALELDPRLAMAHYWIAQWGGLWDPKLCRDESQQAMSLAEGLALPRSQKLRMRIQYLGCSGQIHEAKDIAQTLTVENPHDPEAWYRLAVLSFSDGDMAQSASAMEGSLSLDPKLPEALLHHSYLQAYLGNFSRAVESARRYQATLEPGDANGLDLFGDVYSMFGRLDEAAAFYRQEDDPGKIARTALHQGNYELAESELRRQIPKLPPNSPWRGFNHGFLGDVEVARGNLDRAGPHFEEAVRAYGSRLSFGADVMFKGSQVYLEQGDPRGVLAFTGRLSNPYRAGLRGVADLLLGKNAEAEVEFADLRTSISVVVGDVVANQAEQLLRGVAASYGHQPAEAIALLAALPFSWRMLTALPLGRAYLEQGDFAHAEETLNFVLKSQFVWGLAGWEERHNMLALLLAHYCLGELCEKQGRPQEAASHYRKFYSHFEHSHARLPQIAAARLALRRLSAAR